MYKLFDGMSPAQISHKLKIDNVLVNKIYDDELKSELIPFSAARKICEHIGLPITEVFDELDMSNKVEQDPNLENMTDNIIMGLKSAIVQRLEAQKHSKDFTEVIINYIDDIIIEATYYGVCLHKANKSDKVLHAIKQRRNTHD
jgi:hypothetical protein